MIAKDRDATRRGYLAEAAKVEKEAAKSKDDASRKSWLDNAKQYRDLADRM